MPRTLSLGMQGDDVSSLQQLLNYHLSGKAAAITVNSKFDNDTDSAVRLFQSLNNEMPDNLSAASFGNTASLVVDGQVGHKTRAVLLDARAISFTANVQPAGGGNAVSSAFRNASFSPVANFASKTLLAQAAPLQRGTAFGPVQQAAPFQQAPPVPLHRQFQLFVGQQVNVNPWSLQPLVITGQFNWLAKRDGSPDFVLTLGGQVSLNQVNGPNGNWTGQGFAQMGLNGIFKVGNFDLLNPFVVVMLQKNQGQPFGIGTGIGNQMNYNLTPDGFVSLFLNSQLVVNTGLNNGLTSAPGLQILGGVGFTFDSKN